MASYRDWRQTLSVLGPKAIGFVNWKIWRVWRVHRTQSQRCMAEFENINEGKRAIHRIAPLARAIANVAERIHVLNRVDVSQLIVAAKKPI